MAEIKQLPSVPVLPSTVDKSTRNAFIDVATRINQLIQYAVSTASQLLEKVNSSDVSITPTEQKIPKTAPGTSKLNKDWIPGLLVAETIISGSAVTSISFTGLDAVAHGGYALIGHIRNTTTSKSNYSFFMNGDTTQTNYQNQFVVAVGTVVACNTENNAQIAAAEIGATSNFLLNINSSSTSKTSICGHAGRTGVISSAFLEKTAIISNLTQLDIVGSISNSIGIGSTIRLYRRL